MMCILWCRPVPRVPIAKNSPPNKNASEVEETVKWTSIFTHNEHFRNWLQLKFASSIQSEIKKIQNSEELKSSDENNGIINFEINKAICPNITLSTVKTIETIEGTAISSFPISLSSDIRIEIETIITENNDSRKKVKSVAIISSKQPTIQITIPYEKGLISIELILGLDAQVSFEDDIVTEETKDGDGKIQEKDSNLSTQEDIQIKSIKKLLSQFLNHASFKFDVDTVPVEEEKTTDKITETGSKEIEGVGNPSNPELPSKDDIPSTIPENIVKLTTTETEAIDENHIDKNEPENKNEEEKSEGENDDKNEDDDDEDDDEDDEEYATGKISPIRREFVVDQEIKEIVDEAASLINDKTVTNSATSNTASNENPQ